MMQTLLDPTTLIFIKEVGFPITLSLMVVGFIISILIYIIKRDAKRQESSDKRYEELVNNFITQIREISDKHDIQIREISDKHDEALKKIYIGFRDTASKIDSYAKDIQTYVKSSENGAKWIVDEIRELKEDLEERKVERKERKGERKVIYPPFPNYSPGKK
jgi:uncharacterized membrane-anchored protein YhcB (DUF1043 family)